jgi:hypothetical protein
MKLILDLPGGPAFPISIPGYGDNGCAGMSLRDWFASQVMATMISKCESRDGTWDAAAAALACYEIADVMLEARDLDRIAIKHPTGSEQFAAHLDHLGIPAPWTLCDESCGEVLAANKAVACMALDTGGAVLDERATQAALWIICAVNTLSGFKAEIPK